MKLIEIDSVDSTNEEAFRRCDAGEPAPFFIRADQQTAGRGRSGRVWISPSGNLHMSALILDAAKPALLPQLGFVAGLALIDALIAVSGRQGFQLKWPNDVIVNGAKLAGLLLETRQNNKGTAVVIGWGVNITVAPDQLPYKAIALCEIAPAASASVLAQHIAKNFELRLAQWQSGANFCAVRVAWVRFALPYGTPLKVHASEIETLHGTFDGLDEEGRLRLATAGGVQIFSAGDVHLSQSAL